MPTEPHHSQKTSTLPVQTVEKSKEEPAVTKDVPKVRQPKLTKTPSVEKIQQGIQKEDPKLQQRKLSKTSSIDKTQGIQKEDPKLQQVKLAKALSADKIQPGVQKEDPKLQGKLTKTISADKIQQGIWKEDTKLQQQKLVKVPPADKIQPGVLKEDPKLQQEKLVKASSADKIQMETEKEDPKPQKGKLAKTSSVDKIHPKISSDQKQPLSKLIDDKKSALPEKKASLPEDRKEQFLVETKEKIIEEKLEVKGPPKEFHAQKQEEVKKEDLTPGLPQIASKPDKNKKEDTSAQVAPVPRLNLVETVKEKTEKEDDKSETSSSQQQKSPQAQASTLAEEKSGKTEDLYELYGEQTKDQYKTKALPITPESYSSDEEDLADIQEEDEEVIEEDGKQSIPLQKGEKVDAIDDASTRRQRYDSVEDSSESENSPVPRRKRQTSVGSSSSDEYKQEDSPGSGDDEDFIRKQIIEMSADEDASGSEDEEFIRNQLKEISGNESQKKEEVKGKVKGTAGKHKRLTRKSSTSYDEDPGRRHSWHDDDDETFDESPEPKYRESKSQDSEELALTGGSGGGGLRRFKTIELNSTIANKYSEVSEQQKVEDTYNGAIDANLIPRQDESNEFIQQRGRERKIRSSDQIYEEPMQKIKDLQKDYYSVETLHSIVPQEDIVSSSYIIPESHEIIVLDSVVTSATEEKQLLDAEAAYEELMKRQGMQLTPGSSPTQPTSDLIPGSDTMGSTVRDTVDGASLTLSTPSSVSDMSSVSSTVLSIPDVKITQHFTVEDIEDEYLTDYAREIQEIISHETSILTYSEASESATSVLPSDTASLTSSTSSVCTTDSSSPIPGIDRTGIGYIDTIDALSKLADSEGISSITQVPISSTKEYAETTTPYEPIDVPPQKPVVRAGHVVDHVVISLPTAAPSAVTITDIKLKQYTSDSITLDLSIPEKDSAREIKSTETAVITKVLYEDVLKGVGTSTHAVTWATTKPVTVPPVGATNGWTDVSASQEPMEDGAVDLSTTKSHRTMVTADEAMSGVITTLIEDDEKPVDLTAGRRAVCCDMVYKLPFGRSCTAQQPPTTLPEDRFGYRDDHYQYDRSGSYSYRTFGGMKPSMSDTNLSEAGLFAYKSKNSFEYRVGATDAAVDLTSGRVTTGEVMDYSSKTTGPYPETRQVISGIGISAPQYSQARMVPSLFGVGSVLRSSNGVVYSSVATPIPSTFAITTQPGSIFSTTVRDLSTLQTIDSVSSLSSLQQNQPLPRSYSFLTTVAAEKDSAIVGIDIDTGLQPLAIETITTETTSLMPTLTTASEGFTDVIEDEVALLVAPEEDKQQQLDLERELLELEKLKQQRFAEELEWERQEIQRFREQEKFMVQKKLEELQSMKHHLLFQQEEERQAQFMMRQETLAQQQLQLEQIQQLQQQLHQQLEEQKIRQIYQYNYDPSGNVSPQTTTDQVLLEGQYAATENGQFWTSDDTTTTASAVLGIEIPQSQTWYTVQSDGVAQYISRPGMLSSVSEMSLKDIDAREEKQLKKRSSMPKLRGQYDELDETLEEDPRCFKKIMDSGVQTDDEDGADRGYTNRRRRTKKSVDTSVQTDDEDQEEWDLSSRSRRKARVGKYNEGTPEVDKSKPFSKVSSIAVQTVAEISVQTEPVGTIRTPSIRARLDAKVEIIKHISAPEKTYTGESLGCQTETDSDTQSPQYLTTTSPQKDKKRPTPLEIGYSSHLRADSTLQVVPSPPKSPKVLYSPISPVSPSKVIESAFVPYEKPITDDISPQKILHADIANVPPPSPKSAKMMQRSLSDPKPLSPTAEDSSRTQFQYTEGFMTKGSSTITPSGTQKKVKRTLPNPPPEDATTGTQSAYSTVGSVSRRRICRTTTMARAKILQDIDRELDLVERESAKLRKKQAELDEEEKEIDAKLRYLEMGINRRKEALLKEREKRERAYLQGVAEERDYMSDSEVNNARSTRIETQHGLERPRTAPQTEFNQFMPPQTQPETQFAPATSPYTQYQYSSPALPTQAPTQYTQQSHYQQQQPLYHQQVSPYQTQPAFQAGATLSFTPQPQPPPTQQPSYQLPSQMMVIPQKPRQAALYLEPKITTNYDVIRNQPLMIAPVSTDNNYAVSQLGSKYNTLDLRIGLDERSSMASSPISSISAESFYADIDHHHAPRNYVLIDDIGELTKGTGTLSSAFSLHEKDLTKTDRLLRTTETRRAQEVTDFLAPLQTSSRLHTYVKADEDPMEDPYELKLLKHQIKQEFRRGAESLDHLAGLSQYYHADTGYRHFPKSEKYSISRLTLEKQAAKQLPAALLYQKQSKHKKALIDPKLSKFSPIQESRDLEPDYSSYMTSSTSSLGGITSRARLLQDDITFGLRKNITDQQKFLGPSLTSSIGASLGSALGPTMRSTLQDEADKSYSSGSRSRPSSRPSSVYGLDLSLKRDSSSSSLRLKAQEAEPLDVSFSHVAPSGRTKPTSLPISQSRGRIPIVAQNSEEESPLSPVGQPMGMARAAAGPLPPISADTRDQFGSSHSLPEVQQHMREESRTRGYDRDIAFIMDDFQHAMSDSEAYHLRREETDWFDKPRESRLENGHGLERKLPEKLSHSRPPSQHQDQINGKPLQYIFPHARLKILRDPKDHTVSGNGLGIRVVGGKEIPGNSGEIGAYIAKILPGGSAEQTGKLMEEYQK
ncbi:hypothetical protein Y1Q_0023406 [Alligator mississippiensis]|uniref:PDZ domain-containing protein n=1 Tax=Alligator mississippiensis TaxID=8496 RepID=A0A151NPJ1_ALLMI|nr:hypothetical protein Y1Q_0023406 [Alligator mississippiensis]